MNAKAMPIWLNHARPAGEFSRAIYHPTTCSKIQQHHHQTEKGEWDRQMSYKPVSLCQGPLLLQLHAPQCQAHRACVVVVRLRVPPRDHIDDDEGLLCLKLHKARDEDALARRPLGGRSLSGLAELAPELL